MGSSPPDRDVGDVFIIGGGINGCGIARDAAGRGLSVTLAEMNDLASATSSASTKLFHGGLRYLEYFEFRLVREALKEREVLLRAMPHISWPMRFVLPYRKGMTFESEAPLSRLLAITMPWLKGRRPAWLIRTGLMMYDHLGGREILPGTRTLSLEGTPEGDALDPAFSKAFEYSDCWVQDSRLVVLNARDAAARGARILTRTKVVRAERGEDHWTVTTEGPDGEETHLARLLVNAGGPWVGDVIHRTLGINSRQNVRLVRGSHIVTRRLYDHDKCYIFQGRDGRVIFTIPYEDDFTLIGTTDVEHADPWTKPEATPDEVRYLCDFASQYLRHPVAAKDIVHTYSGVRPLYDDGAKSATAATREYVLDLNREGGAPLLNVFGGKITTYRKLAEAAMDRMARVFHGLPGDWTAGVTLPGGDFPVDGAAALTSDLRKDYPFLDEAWARRMVRHYGTDTRRIFGDARTSNDLGEAFGAGITARELDWARREEWVRTAEDFLWRRTRLGLRLSPEETQRIDAYLAAAGAVTEAAQ